MARELARSASSPLDRLRGVPGWLRARPWPVGITVAGLLVRLGIILRADKVLTGDPLYYHWQANLVARGNGFIQPAEWNYLHQVSPGADHPPLQTLWLALWSVVGLHTVRWHLVAGAIVGALTISLVYATADLVAGRRAAIAAAVMAAVWPNLIYWSVGGYAESIASTCVALFSYLGVRYLQRPSMGRLVAVGAAASLAGLARSELILLLAGVVPLVLAAHPLSRELRIKWVAASVGVAIAMVLPWAAYNQARFAKPVPLSTGLGLVLVSSNCDAEYYGQSIGYWWFNCSSAGSVAARATTTEDHSELDGEMRKVAVRYAKQHPSRLPAVATARLGRMFGVFQPENSITLSNAGEGIDRWIGGAITSTWWLAMALGAVGGVTLRRRGQQLSPLLMPVIVIAITAVVSYGIVRFRAPCEPAVLVLAGVTVDQICRWFEARGAGSPEATVRPRPAVTRPR